MDIQNLWNNYVKSILDIRSTGQQRMSDQQIDLAVRRAQMVGYGIMPDQSLWENAFLEDRKLVDQELSIIENGTSSRVLSEYFKDKQGGIDNKQIAEFEQSLGRPAHTWEKQALAEFGAPKRSTSGIAGVSLNPGNKSFI